MCQDIWNYRYLGYHRAMKSVAIVGFGRFGEMMADLCKRCLRSKLSFEMK